MSAKVSARAVVLTLLLASAPAVLLAQASTPWLTDDGKLRLYFFWTESCPHCQVARPFVDELAQRETWLDVLSLPLDERPNNVQRYLSLAEAVGENAYSVPAFLFCGRLLTGFDNGDGSGALLVAGLDECRSQLAAGQPPWESAVAEVEPEVEPTRLPFFGEVTLTQWSLPLVAVVLGALDSFNPCAFFVLLFLLSLLVNARSRSRMLLVGGLFVTVSGVVYFLFMAAWLNVFLLFGQLAWVTAAAGLLAVCFGALNLKDYFFLGQGPSLSVPDEAKPGLFKRMRTLVSADNLSTVLVGTLTLAIIANSYELLCTAGFPMVFTRLLTLKELPLSTHYAYLALYCAVYVVPLLVIVGLFVRTLGRRKLSEREGRILKLLSGFMMAGLGGLLLLDPLLLSNVAVTAGLVLAAVLLTWVVSRWDPLRRSPA